MITLQERDILHVGATMADRNGLPFRATTDGGKVNGKFAIFEKAHEFTLVPWRPVIDRQLGREVMGVIQGGSVSWQLGRRRGPAL